MDTKSVQAIQCNPNDGCLRRQARIQKSQKSLDRIARLECLGVFITKLGKLNHNEFPIAVELSKNGVNLPSSALMGDEDIDYICKTLIDAIQIPNG